MLCRKMRYVSSLPCNITRLGPYHGEKVQDVNNELNLSKCWPTVDQIEIQMSSSFYSNLPTVSKESETKKVEMDKKIKSRLDKIERNLKNYSNMIDKYNASQIKAEKEKDEKEAILERRMREIHEYFGYWMDPKDPRFEVMLEQKEVQEKKADKLAKRAQLIKKKIAEVM